MDVLSHKIKIKMRFANQSSCPPVVQNTCNIAIGKNIYNNKTTKETLKRKVRMSQKQQKKTT